MMAATRFIRRHPVLTYFALTFAISWGGVVVVVGPGGIPGTTDQLETLFPVVFLAMLAGPSVAGVLLTGLVHGRAGFRESLSALCRWRVGAGWYAVAMLTAPLVMAATVFALWLTSVISLPAIFTSDDRASRVLFGVAVALGAGFFEELGWTAFAVPELRRRHGVLTTGLILGMTWGAWHFLVNVWASGSSSGALASVVFLPAVLFSLLIGALPAYRMLMLWVYDRTRSLLVAMLMHVSLTASTLILRPSATGVSLVTFDLLVGAVLWTLVAAVALAGTGQRSRLLASRRVA